MAECLMDMGQNLNTQMGIYIEANISNPGQTPQLIVMHLQYYPPGPTMWKPPKWAEEYQTANHPSPAACLSSTMLLSSSSTNLSWAALMAECQLLLQLSTTVWKETMWVTS